MEQIIVKLLADLDYRMIDMHNHPLPDDAEIIRLIHDAITAAYEAGESKQNERLMSRLEDVRFNAKAARYCAAVIWGRYNDFDRVKNVPPEDFGDAEIKAEEWCHMYIDGPDVGVSWDRFELEQDEAGIQAKEVDESGKLELKVNVGPAKGSVFISKEMWEAIGEKFENE